MIDIEKDKNPPKFFGKYPWEQMEVGDSFYVENPPRNKFGYALSLTTNAHRKFKDKRFTQRVEGNGVRVWRIK